MKASKVTPWFKASEHKPIRNGWYEVIWSLDSPETGYMRFHDGKWKGNYLGGFGGHGFDDYWRGLARKSA